jgi:hypothetical protein
VLLLHHSVLLYGKFADKAIFENHEDPMLTSLYLQERLNIIKKGQKLEN